MKPLSDMKNRRKKVQYRTSRSGWHGTATLYPALLIAGRWFKIAGFCIGDIVDITVNQNEIIIRKNHDHV
jgi:hypothetical protein